MKFSSLILATLAIAKVYSAQCGKGIGSCGNNECCSKYGWCGTSNAYCGSGCQENYGLCDSTKVTQTHTISTNGRCGSDNGNTACPDNKCCSKYGWCGTSDKYCGSGCQSEFGRCNGTSNTTTKKTTTTTTKKTTTTTKKTTTTTTKKTSTTTNKTTTTTTKTSTYPVSTNGQCGPQNGNAVCSLGECCSKYGWCGSSDKYCGSGCQPEYGICNNSNTTTTKNKTTTTTKKTTTTSKISHPTSTNGQCGVEYGNTACPNNECCSKYGWCGTSDKYCGSGCQAEFGRCTSSGSSSTTTTTNTSTKTKTTNSTSKPSIATYRKCKKSNHWALTFDDGPYIFDEALLDYLASVGVKATFFVNGKNVMKIYSEEGQKIIKRMVNEGHEVASHTYTHADLTTLSENGIKEEITELEIALQDIIGKKPAFIRPPYGEGADSSSIKSVLQKLGYTAVITWNVDTLDWDNQGNTDYALSVFSKHIGEPIISLNHCYYTGITESRLINSAKKEINYMLSKGYKPVTMSECLELDAYQ